MTSASPAADLALPKFFWNHIFVVASYLLFWSATIHLVITGLSQETDYQTKVAASGALYIAGFICFFTSRVLTKHGYRKLKSHVIEWAKNKYGIEFDAKEARSLITPLYGRQTKRNYHSHNVRQWYETDNGRKELATFSIIVVDKTPILYRQEIAGEFPTEEERERQQIISVFAEEIGGNKVVYLYNEENVLAPKQTDKPTLLWSDSLRVDLFIGKDDGVEHSAVLAIPLEAFFEKWVPAAVAHGIKVGINWDENSLLFDTNKLFNS